MQALWDEMPVNQDVTILSCSPRSLSYNPRRVFERLQRGGTFTDSNGKLTADFWAFVYDVSNVAASDLALFEAKDTRAAAIHFMANAPMEGQKVVFDRENPPGKAVVCDPAPISIKLN